MALSVGPAPGSSEETNCVFRLNWDHHIVYRGEICDAVVMEGRGFGFATFTDGANAATFLETREHTIDGKRVEAKAAVPKPKDQAYQSRYGAGGAMGGGMVGLQPVSAAHAPWSCFRSRSSTHIHRFVTLVQRHTPVLHCLTPPPTCHSTSTIHQHQPPWLPSLADFHVVCTGPVNLSIPRSAEVDLWHQLSSQHQSGWSPVSRCKLHSLSVFTGPSQTFCVTDRHDDCATSFMFAEPDSGRPHQQDVRRRHGESACLSAMSHDMPLNCTNTSIINLRCTLVQDRR